MYYSFNSYCFLNNSNSSSEFIIIYNTDMDKLKLDYILGLIQEDNI